MRIPKQHQLLGEVEGDSTIEILKWFSNNYYSVLERQDGKLQFNDMRYGVYNATKAGIGEDDFILNLLLSKTSRAGTGSTGMRAASSG